MGDVLQEAGLSNIWVSTDEEGSRVGVDGGKTSQMASDLLQVYKRISHALADCGHATECGSFQLLALVKRLPIFKKSDIISSCQSINITYEDLRIN